MKIKLGHLKEIINETITELPDPRDVVTVDTLQSFQEELDDALANGKIDRHEYEGQWRDTLHAVGWTEQEYEEEIDRRWDYIDDTRGVVPRPRNIN